MNNKYLYFIAKYSKTGFFLDGGRTKPGKEDGGNFHITRGYNPSLSLPPMLPLLLPESDEDETNNLHSMFIQWWRDAK